MDFKKEIKDRGLSLVFVAREIKCNYSSFKVYMNNYDLLPLQVECDLKTYIKSRKD